MPTIDILGEVAEIAALEDSLKKHRIGEAQELRLALLNLLEEWQQALLPAEKITIVEKQIKSLAENIDQNIGMRYKFTDELESLNQERTKVSLELEEQKQPDIVNSEISNSKIAIYDSQIREIDEEINTCQNSAAICEDIISQSQKEKSFLENQLTVKKYKLEEKEQNLALLDQHTLEELDILRAQRAKILYSMQEQGKSQFVETLEKQQAEITEELSSLEEEKAEFERLLLVNRTKWRLLAQIQSGEVILEEDKQLQLESAGGVEQLISVYHEQFNHFRTMIETLDEQIEDIRLQELNITQNLNDSNYIENNYLLDQDIEEQLKIKRKGLTEKIDRDIAQIDAGTQEYTNTISEHQAEIQTIEQKIHAYDITIREHSGNLENLEKKLRILEEKKQEILQDKKLLKVEVKEAEELNTMLNTANDPDISLVGLNREMHKLQENINNIEKMVLKQFELLHQFEALLVEVKQLSLSNNSPQAEGPNEYSTSSVASSIMDMALEKVLQTELAEAAVSAINKEQNSKPQLAGDIIPTDEGFESDRGGKGNIRNRNLLFEEDYSNNEQENDRDEQEIDEKDDLLNTTLVAQEDEDEDLTDDIITLKDRSTPIDDSKEQGEDVPQPELVARNRVPRAILISDEGFESDIGEGEGLRKQDLLLEEPFSSEGDENDKGKKELEENDDLMDTTLVAEEDAEEDLIEDVVNLKERVTAVENVKIQDEVAPQPELVVSNNNIGYDPRTVLIDFLHNSYRAGNLGVEPSLESSHTLEYAAGRGSVSPTNSLLDAHSARSLILTEGFEGNIDEEEGLRKQDLLLEEPFSRKGQENDRGEKDIEENADLMGTTLVVQENADEDLIDGVGVEVNRPPSPMKHLNNLNEEVVGVRDNVAQSINSVAIETAPREELTAVSIVNSEECGTRSDGAKPICNRRATSNDVTNFSSIDYNLQDNIVAVETAPSPDLVDLGGARDIGATHSDSANLFSEVGESLAVELTQPAFSSRGEVGRDKLSSADTVPPLTLQEDHKIKPARQRMTLYYSTTKINDDLTNKGESSNSLGAINGLLKIIAPGRDNEINSTSTKHERLISGDKTPISKIDRAVFADHRLNENSAGTNQQLNDNKIIQNNISTIFINNTFPLGGQVDALLPMLPFIFMQTNKDKWISRMNRRKHKNIILTSRYEISTSG